MEVSFLLVGSGRGWGKDARFAVCHSDDALDALVRLIRETKHGHRGNGGDERNIASRNLSRQAGRTEFESEVRLACQSQR